MHEGLTKSLPIPILKQIKQLRDSSKTFAQGNSRKSN